MYLFLCLLKCKLFKLSQSSKENRKGCISLHAIVSELQNTEKWQKSTTPKFGQRRTNIFGIPGHFVIFSNQTFWHHISMN